MVCERRGPLCSRRDLHHGKVECGEERLPLRVYDRDLTPLALLFEPGAAQGELAYEESRERLDHFNRAVRQLPNDLPINVILFAMEGDPDAAPAFWVLALRTGGSMLAPSEDWP